MMIMYGEIDLELYTLSIIRLNTAFEKLDSSNTDEVKVMFEESLNDLNTLYNDIVDDLNQDEVNLNEYYLFFQNGKQTFPQYIEMLGSVENESLEEVIGDLMNVFNNLNKIADAFPKNDMINAL
ncbi:hypothetical protein [Methanobrevibacter sp.]|uniref:hypothetical protein n=1 Tax=Methanobrevibacter sp. TaxID=66852 RepID=UPI002E77DBAC|nr:hypothetical protein [Methanobrevibacter sp.]